MATLAAPHATPTRQRTDGFRFDVLNTQLVPVGQLHPVEPGVSVENNIYRDIKRTMSGFVIPATEAVSLNYFSNRLRPVWLFEDDPTEYPLGVFLVSDASTVPHTWGTTAELTLADQGLILSQLIDRSIGYQAGQSIQAAMLQVATEYLQLPAVQVDDTDARLGAPVAWAMGRDTWARVLNDLADLAGFNSGWFDNRGTLRLRRAPAASDEAPPDFDYDLPGRVLVDSIVNSDATIDSPNRYVVISTSGQLAPVIGVWDVPPSAPHSYQNRGFRVLSVTERQGLSLQQANDAARVRGQQDADTYQWSSFAAAPDPRHDTFNVVRWRGANWREQSWSLQLEPGGEHRHELRRSYTP